MSRIFEALNRAETARHTPNANHGSTAQPEMTADDVSAMNGEPPETMQRLKVLNEVSSMPVETVDARSVSVKAPPGSRWSGCREIPRPRHAVGRHGPAT
jgi:hypothetical protein